MKDGSEKAMDLTALRARLANCDGRTFWRSLEALADTPEFQDLLRHEFPRQADAVPSAVDRREFLKLAGASLALAGLTACTRQPAETIVPYVKQPEDLVLGQPMFYATAMPLGGFGTGLLAESHEGRPTKCEGNPDHPASLGATNVFGQAAILSLYDPDRAQVFSNADSIRSWSAFVEALQPSLSVARARRGGGLRILTGTVTSPTLATQLRTLLTAMPEARWHQWEPVNRDSERAGAKLAFGEAIETRYRFDRADVILTLDADFLSAGPGHLRYTREFTRRRRPPTGTGSMARLYAVESTPSLTGVMADHRLSCRASEIEGLARALATRLGLKVGRSDDTAALRAAEPLLAALVADLRAHRGRTLVIAGDTQPPAVHALAHALNDLLGNVGQTVEYTAPVEAEPTQQLESLRALVADMDAGTVDILVVLGGNPVYTAPADFRFDERLAKVGLRVRLGLYADETSALCHWHIPEAHFLESWSDVRAYDGTVSILQPLIAPLYGGKTSHEVLAALAEHSDQSSHDIVRDYWKTARGGDDFETFWRTALHDGVVPGTTLAPKTVALRATFEAQAAQAPAGMELIFRPDPHAYDGAFTNNGWLQELPKPLSKLTWDNAALIAPVTAEHLGLANEDVVELSLRGRRVEAPVWILPGHPSDAVTVTLGYGRTHAGRVASGTGYNAYLLRTSDGLHAASGVELRKTGRRWPLACTQDHQSMEGRDIVRVATLEEYRRHPGGAADEHKEELPLGFHPEGHYPGYAWGMAIDLSTCTGCNACTIACQAENNISIVGKDQVIRGREMHWIRVDRYFEGDLDHPETVHQPVPCMQCEHAPCEVVCPVKATAHSSEGLNDMVYNRCVGTRYCSNNCPYKVRRFNFYLYSNWTDPQIQLAMNPDVTVRTRGVMEKCTYCVQRINAARITAEQENRPIRDGDIQTACQQVCPAEAIAFGNINDPASKVSRLKAEARNYTLLEELNTRPRTTYLSAVRNPNPGVKG